MSTNANAIFGRLRELIEATDLNLSQISGRTKIPLNKLWRFKCKEKSLSMEDAEKLHIELTGKTFIAAPDDL
jgi:hypothetical protein